MFGLPQTDAQAHFPGPEDMRLYADFLPLIGEFTLRFSHLERYVTWAIESFIGANRWDGNELEGLVQNFTSRIKFLDVSSRSKCRDDEAMDAERLDVINALSGLNTFRNKLLHNSVTGICYPSGWTPLTIAMNFKRLDKDKGTERPYEISVADLVAQNKSILDIIDRLRRWVHFHCPHAEKRVP